MSEKVIIGNAELWLGDCREILASMHAEVDAVITDPPYEKEAHTKGRRLLGKQVGGARTVEYGALDFAEIDEETRQAVSDSMARLCLGWMLTFCQAEAVSRWKECHEAAGAKYKRACVWIKPDGAPQFTGDRPGMGYESIVASWCGEGRSKWSGGGEAWGFRASAARQQQPERAYDAEAHFPHARAGRPIHQARRHHPGSLHG